MVEGEWDWMNSNPFLRGQGGFGMAPSAGAGGLFSSPQISGGLFGGEAGAPKRDAMMAFAAQLLAGSGASPVRRGFGELVGEAMLASQQARAVSEDRAQERRFRDAQIKDLEARPTLRARAQSPFGTIDPDQFTPESLKKFQETQDYGVLQPRAGAATQTADIENYKFWQSLTPEQQRQFMALQRQPTMPTVIDYMGGKAWADRANQVITPVSSAEQEAGAAGTIAAGTAAGKVRGETTGGIEKKGINAQGVLSTLEIADPLIDIATGSATGAGLDKVAAFFGEATDGAKATAQLKILQAGLMLSMPRMEGPQSDKDTQLYREAAGQLGDPTVPRATKKAAVKTIREIQRRYQEQAGVESAETARPSAAAPPAAIEHLRKNPGLKAQFRAKYGYLPDDI